MREPQEDTVEYDPAREFADAFFAPPQRELQLSFGAATHVGRVRKQNEDHYAILRLRRAVEPLHSSLDVDELPTREARTHALVVADGMGGMKSGELASRIALQTMVDLAGQATSWVMKLTDLDAQQIEQRADAYVKRIHAKLEEQGKADPAHENMGTTWTSAHILGECAVIVHLGDSRAYLYRSERLTQITRDETMAQSLIEAGIEPGSVKKFRHVLLNSFGGGSESAQASLYILHLSPNDKLLLCSDGLSDMVSDQDIADTLHQHGNAQTACDELVAQALTAGGRDNVTVVLASIDEASDKSQS